MVEYNYIFVGLLLIVAVVFAVAPLVVVWIVAPRKRSLAKGDAYECGVRTYGETWVRFPHPMRVNLKSLLIAEIYRVGSWSKRW